MLSQEWIGALLQRGREHLGMQLGWVAQHLDQDVLRVMHVDGALDSGGIAVGTELAYESTFCARVVGDGPAAVVPDLASDPRTRPLAVRTDLGIGSYAGAPIRLRDGTRYGMLCCFSTEPNPDLQTAQARVLAFIADLIGERLDAQTAAEAARDATRTRILQVMERGGPDIQFQAVFDLPAFTVRGWEALSRFPAGFGGPDKWFTEAAEIGLGAELEIAAIRNAINHLPMLPPSARIGVNVSPATLAEPELLDWLHTVNPASLLIEITEHEAIADYAALARPLEVLRELGIPTAADDTGAGYAGLRHLVELRPTGIKLDRAIVAGIASDPARRAVAAAMVAYAHETDTILLAEGVETLQELTTLYDLGITVVQGYLLHRPQTLQPGITVTAPDAVRDHLDAHAHATPIHSNRNRKPNSVSNSSVAQPNRQKYNAADPGR